MRSSKEGEKMENGSKTKPWETQPLAVGEEELTKETVGAMGEVGEVSLRGSCRKRG